MLDDDVRALLDGANIAHLATLMADGSPHSAPLWVGVEGEQLAIFTGPRTVKARNLDRDPRVALSITDAEQPLRGALIRGRVHDRLEGDQVWPIIDRMSQTYQGTPYPREEEFVVYLITPERVKYQAY
ncbi:PPOX class F420-dependent oxidoreductase [Solirubrobacter sp. CPCC 204708]|uniref:PPOX class F420-dependent oxidoreductase n=1 Tax=Solirubrobacter deserti TaxID=2282478 RepID=A0ABT4RBS9_9ACTN|nr:PPOX class F420-dependent oxidoreductase [Solirubrobacter deserti]MBE2317114.1 PPOX class F420-dependent oxidoreductase [Solirubrobacter deserti]MDA0135994.1 PPOX class F420-dependent oxidoreductase [Solirubrobacter deserti]